MSVRRKPGFAHWLTLVGIVALALRVSYVVVFRFQHVPLQGDSYFFSQGANLLADGHGFVEPLSGVQSANHPPLYLLWLAIVSVLDPHSPTSQGVQMLWSCVLGTGTVVVCGLAGREVVGPRCGLVAAALAAVYPGLWVWDGMLFSETMAQFTVAVVILMAYRFWHRPSRGRAAWLGLTCGLAALARSELVLTVPLLVVPLALYSRNLAFSRRLLLMGVGGVTAALTLLPWVAFNLSRFEKPVYISSNFGPTLAAANCDATYYGNDLGYKNYPCAQRAFDAAERADPRWRQRDVSEQDAEVRERTMRYVRAHAGRLPAVVAVRWARVVGLYERGREVLAARIFYKRERPLAEATSWSYYGAAALAIAGGITLRRKRVPVFPLVAFPVVILISVAVTFGQDRYRAPADVALLVLAAVALDSLAGRRST